MREGWHLVNPNLLHKLQKDTGTFSPTSSRESLSQFLVPHPFPMMFNVFFNQISGQFLLYVFTLNFFLLPPCTWPLSDFYQ